jgi:DNA-binding SARP family transcriptional activator
VSVSPLRESAYGLLMAALEAEGNVAEALVVYEDARRLLRDELGVAPAEPLQQRYLQLLRTAPDA